MTSNVGGVIAVEQPGTRPAASHPMLPLLGAGLLCVLFPALAGAQEIRLDLPGPRNDAHAQRVNLDTDSLTLGAGKPEWVELRFHVAAGFHINSHAPHDEMLIPTSLTIPGSPPFRILQTLYPDGQPMHLNIGAGETLSTYSDNFRIRLQVLAPRGEAVLAGSLHYQACDTASCFPPRDLPVRVALSAR